MVHVTTNSLPFVFNKSGDLGHQAVGKGQQFDGVDRGFVGALFHLDFAGAAFGRAGLQGGTAQPVDQSQAGAQTAAVVFGEQPEGACHAGAAFFEVFDSHAGNQAQEMFAGRADLQGL